MINHEDLTSQTDAVSVCLVIHFSRRVPGTSFGMEKALK